MAKKQWIKTLVEPRIYKIASPVSDAFYYSYKVRLDGWQYWKGGFKTIEACREALAAREASDRRGRDAIAQAEAHARKRVAREIMRGALDAARTCETA
jgi:hypothetical protein